MRKTKPLSKQVYVAVNKNGNIVVFTEMPTRNVDFGVWESKYPFVNSLFYSQIVDLISKSCMSWESEPEFFEINFE